MRTGTKRQALLLATLLVLCTACEQADDVDGIFTAASWSFTGFCYTPNWNKAQCNMLDIDLAGKNDYYLHTITFHGGGSASISMPGCALTAQWDADGSSRSFALTNVKVTSGSLSALTPFSRKFYEELTSAAWYRGNSLGLQLFNADEHYYLLFGPIQ